MNGYKNFLVNGTDSDREENCESDFEELSKIALEAPIASEATQSAVKKGLCKHKNPIACPECGKLMKNERGAKKSGCIVEEPKKYFYALFKNIISFGVYLESYEGDVFELNQNFLISKNITTLIQF
ncbi:hypothetical protein BpHYR1_023693 [Brachionus plicatilis]|uniref:Uncharacterized protein n=1 Tax=Brachionus plicatilis TaxID=10195 RepID=A0A3M7PTP9_BRAPC|nr:hypothetical protein BpHYR1_023693 [Brachionus plicatilis]